VDWFTGAFPCPDQERRLVKKKNYGHCATCQQLKPLSDFVTESLCRECGAPARPQVLYRFFDEDGDLMYVGISLDPTSRFRSHRRDKPWWTEVHSITLEHFPDRAAVERAEIEAIRAERPRHNIAHTAEVPAAVKPVWEEVSDDDLHFLSIVERQEIDRRRRERELTPA
jgi:hypothetical protein